MSYKMDCSGVLALPIPYLDISSSEVPVFPRPQIPVFLIAMLGNKERKENIEKLIDKFHPFVIKAVLNNSPQVGNCLSHYQVARMAKLLFPDKSYLVLEDDAEVVDDNFWSLIEEHKDVDLLYFGYNGVCNHTKPVDLEYVWGTHALLISPSARDAIIEKYDEVDKSEFWTQYVGFDSLLTVIAHKANLTTWKPSLEDRYKYICQKEGYVSFLSGNLRENKL